MTDALPNRDATEQPRAMASRFRAAYEALIEPLIHATIKVVEGEAEITALQARLAATQAERTQLAEQLQAVYQSHSWRVTKPLRRTIAAIRRLRP